MILGTIDVGEFRAMMTQMGETLNEEEYKQLMLLADVNDDGVLDYNGKIKEL